MALPEHVQKNLAVWTGYSAEYAAPGHRAWQKLQIDWGIWSIPESRVHALGDLSQWKGKEVIELGCGTGYISAWLHRLGMRPTGVDITPAQLETCRQYQQEFGIEFPLVEASAENVPLAGEAFDLVVSEYGASIWCDPYKWIPEAARLLRPGGTLVFLRNSTLAMLCGPETGPIENKLVFDWKDLGRMEFDGAVEFHIPVGDMIRLLRANGFEVEDLIEVVAPEDAPETGLEYMAAWWAKRWPSEEIWRARKCIS